MGCGAAMVNTPDQSAHEIILEMVTQAFTLVRDAAQYVNQTSKLSLPCRHKDKAHPYTTAILVLHSGQSIFL